ADGRLSTYAGPEVSIASTKAFTAQMAVLYLFAIYLGQVRGKLTKEQIRTHVRELLALPRKVEKVLEGAPQCEDIAEKYHKMQDFLFLGRAIHYPVAMDGALKLKEVSYIHAEGYPTGETKHGPNALIDETLPVVIIATRDRNDAGSMLRYDRNVANIRGFKQQSARVIAVATEGDNEMRKLADHVIYLPETPELLSPILEIVPLQLFAYYVTVKRGLDVDRPRNLVKSVTLE
ncbi:MAG TPA: SIS domain-containing protein, partial [Terriglobales bacterium]